MMHVCMCVCVFEVVLHNNESEQEAKQKTESCIACADNEKITSTYSHRQQIFI